MPFVIGENVGPYRLVEQLGQGGMATVFKAYHPALNRYVAIKALHPAFTHEPNFLARFQREAQVVAGLEHPNIVPIYDYAEHEGRPYLVMKFIEGETLKARLSRGRLDADEIGRIVESVGAALSYAHAQGVLHRDVKPSNVLLAGDDRIYLADFGLARMAEAGESTLSADVMLGTPQYISPEQAMGQHNLDNGADIYSFGVLLYELVVGKVPYSADTPFSVIHDHIYSPLPMPRSIRPEISESLERVLLKALAKERADRYPDVASMVDAWKQAALLPGQTPLEQPGATTQSRPPAPAVDQSVQTFSQVPSPQTAFIDEDDLDALAKSAMPAPPAGVQQSAQAGQKRRSPWVWVGLAGASVALLCLCAAAFFVFVVRPRQNAATPVGLQNTVGQPVSQPATPIASAPVPIQSVPPPAPVQTGGAAIPTRPGPLLRPSRAPGILATFVPTWVGSPPVPLATAMARTTAEPDNPQVYLDLAMAYWANGNLLEARQALETAGKKAGRDSGFFVRAGDAMAERQAWVFAASLYLDALRFSPKPVPDDLNQKLSLALYLSSGGAETNALINRLPEEQLKPGMVELLRGRSALYRGELILARGSVKRIKENYPELTEVGLLEAEIALREKDPVQGQKELQNLIDNPATPLWAKQAAEFILEQINQPK